MLPYVIFILAIAGLAYASNGRSVFPLPWLAAFVLIWLFVGLRHKVGMDWNNYLLMIVRANEGGLFDSLEVSEPAYAMLLYVSGQLGLGIYLPNLVTALLLVGGVFRYASRAPAPWVALLVACSFLIVVVGMSANRQAAAIGILLWLVSDWRRLTVPGRFLMVLVASSFHASALMFLLFIPLDSGMKNWAKALALGVAVFVAAYVAGQSGRDEYYDNLYLSGQSEVTQSSGAIFHVLLNGGPALLTLYFARQGLITIPDQMHKAMLWIAIALIPMAFIASAASGRIGLYLFPVSMYFFSSMLYVLRSNRSVQVYLGACAAFFPFLLLFWLTGSNTGHAYLPYNDVLRLDSLSLHLCCR